MEKLLVIGAGGHARSVMDLVLQNASYEVVGCIDPHPGDVLGVPVIGDDQDLELIFSKGIRKIFVAIGDNRLRDKLFKLALLIGFEPVNIISPNAVVSTRAHLGKGICVMPGAVINVNTIVNDNCIINTQCSVDHDCNIGRSTHIAPGVIISGSVIIGEGVLVGTGASIINDVTIGNWTIVGGGAGVVDNIPSGVLAYGVPARKMKHLHITEDLIDE